MKREELKELNVPEESINKIMELNGKDIEKAKGDYDVMKSQSDTLQEQLEQANAQIEEFKNMDIESVKAACEDWKTKAETAKEEKESFIHKTKVKDYVKSLNLRDGVYEDHVTKLLLDNKLQFDGDVLIGGDDIVTKFKETYPTAIKEDKPQPKFASATGQTKELQLTKADFEKMKYQDRVKLRNEDPETYEQLKE